MSSKPSSDVQKTYGVSTSHTRGQTLLLITVAGLSLVTEVVIVQHYVQRAISSLQLCVFHTSVVMTLGAYSEWCRRVGHDLRHPLILTVTTLATGPMGPIGTILTLSLTMWFAKATTSFEEWYEALFPRQKSDSTIELYERIQHGNENLHGDNMPTPFGDVLSFGTLPQKQKVISMIMKNFRPAFAPSLQMALRDSNSAVRVQAATAIAKIERDCMTTTLELHAAHQNAPHDASMILRLARHLDDYAYSGILDPAQELDHRNQALHLYHAYLAIRPNDLPIRLAVGRILLREQHYQAAVDWFETSLEQGYSSPQLVLWLMESRFHLGELSAVRDLVKTHNQHLESDQQIPDKVLRAVKLWEPGEASSIQGAGVGDQEKDEACSVVGK